MTRTAIVGPDGTLAIGPFGTVAVAGLTPEQARLVVEKHVARYVAHPRVEVRALASTPQRPVEWRAVRGAAPEATEAGDSVWRPALRDSGLLGQTVATAGWRADGPAPARDSAIVPAVSLPVRGYKASLDTAANDAGPETLQPPRLNPVPEDHVLAPHVVPAPAHGDPAAGHGAPIPRELNKAPLPPYRIEPPDILLVEVVPIGGPIKFDQRVSGQHLVRPDGTIGLGIYGSVYVAGMTFEEAREAVLRQLSKRVEGLKVESINVDVLSYNSKFYYVITDGAGYGEQVVRVPITGNETVLDAISLINGLSPVSSKKHIWLARRNPGAPGTELIYPVDWVGIAERGAAATNYQVFPGDRVYVKADHWRSAYTRIDKVFAPVERLLGVTLLGSEAVNSVRGRGVGGGSTTGR
jgi:polysaccharide export outer membrane protein